MTDTQREFEELWHPICPEYGAITSTHVFKFYEACLSKWQAALAHSQQYEAVGEVFILKQPINRRYPSATFNTTNIREGSILFVKREAITNRKDE